MNNTTIRRVILLAAIALVGIIGMQSYWVINTWDINEEEFNNKVNLALYRVARTLADLNGAELPARDIIKQRTSNYYIVNIANEINASTLEYLLQRELEALALQIDFEYGIFDCNTNKMVYGGFCKFTPGPPKEEELGNLPKDSEFLYYFGVKFPSRSGHLLDKLQLSIFLSVILFVTVAFFVYTMWVILRQKRLSEMQKDFINNMTHEFKTPLSTIKIAAGVFANDPHVKTNPRLARYAQIIHEQNERLNKQVEKVLQLAKIEAGNFEIKMERVPLFKVLQTQLNAIEVQLEEKGGRLITDISDTKDVQLKADRMHLGNILHNLLDNAIKYGGKPPVVQIKAEKTDRQIHIRITDNGTGIPLEQQNRIFDKFYRVPTGDRHDVKGFGLGLYYVKKICWAHQWDIKVEQQQDQSNTGTTFVLSLHPIHEKNLVREPNYTA